MARIERDLHADTIIRNHAMWSIASGAIPLPLADLAAVSAVQLDMIKQLCEVYEVDFNATKGKALVTALTSAALARVGAASIVKLVPIAGTLVGSMAGGVLAGASSFALGTAFKTHLSTGGTILDLDPERLKRVYREQFEKGKETVRQWQQEAAGDTPKEGGFRFEDLVRRKRPDGPAGARSATTAKPSQAAAAADAIADEAFAQRKTQPGASQPNGPTASADADITTKLEELTGLRERGLISEADYEATKQRLLGSL